MKKIKLRNPFRRNKTKLENKTEVPKAWLKETAKPHTSREIQFKRSKIHVPFLKQFNQLIAVVILIVNFIISQATLTSHPDTQPLFWLFIFNSYIAFRYLWVSRRKE